MSSSKKTVVWFRRDLRIEDNPALAAAAREGSVLPVYIWCPKEEGQFYPGRVSRWWLKQSLTHLGQSMRSLGAELILIKADHTLSALLDCINATGATKVVFNHLYDPVSLVRDHTIKEKLVEIGVSVQSFNGDLLHEPWEIYDEKGQAFTTFDAYWQKCQDMPLEPVLLPPPWRLVAATVGGKIEQCSIDELGLENDAEKASNALLGRAWSPGWSNGDRALTEFIENYLMDYSKNRQKVSGNSTSLLSPHLHFGELSIRKVFHSAHMKQILWAKETNTAGQESVKFFMRAVGFREYSRYLLFNFPFTHERSLLRHLRFFPWNTDIDIFKAWRQDRTGYPLVDAGMRELWATGWIHNRIRVIVSSFAVKFLLIPWKWGMKYFWDTLLDADLECDILGWQYVSGSLPDGHELDRLDNPESDGVKFDPDGEYVRQWLPELARLPTEWIHHPWDAPASVLRASGVELGSNYPKPIVEFDLARDNLTQAIFMMREAENSYEAEEIVVDNYEALDTVKPSEPTVITISSNDQKVPSAHKNLSNSLKRQKLRGDDEEEVREGRYGNKSRREYDETDGISRVDERVSSTAESCAGNKQTTGSNMFLVPHACSLLSDGKISEECENSGQSRAWQAHLDEGQSSTKDG